MREDLDPAYAAVQAGHAVSAMWLKYPEYMKVWNNETLIYTKVANIYFLDLAKQNFIRRLCNFAEFYEPDIGEITTLACMVDESDRRTNFLNKFDLFTSNIKTNG